MKKIFNMLLVLFVLFYAYQIVFRYISKGHSIEYDINDNNYTLNVNEKFRSNLKNDADNYSISINAYGDIYNYLIYDDFNKQEKIIDKVRYHIDNEYSCLFVKYIKNQIMSDVICKKGDEYIPFNNIDNPSQELLDFIELLSSDGYYIKDFKDNNDESYKLDDLEIHKSNFVENHFMGIELNSKLYRVAINQKNEKILLNKNENSISEFIDNNYIISKSQEDKIIGFEIYNIEDGKKEEINTEISSNSYYLGYIDKKAYIYDPLNHKEYEIDIKDNTIIEIGNQDTGIKIYNNGVWDRTTYDDFEVNIKEFNISSETILKNENYDKILKYGSNYGYYYYIKKIDNSYYVYRSLIEEPNIKTYIFKTDDVSSIKFIMNGVYYKYSDKIKYYSDKTGNRTIITSNDLLYYKLKYNVFLKK